MDQGQCERRRGSGWSGYALAIGTLGCGGPRDDTPQATGAVTTITAGQTSEATIATDATTADPTADTTEGFEKLDTPGPGPEAGCAAIDFLFVIDNSDSMATYQIALAEQFPEFVAAMVAVLPDDIDVHVGITTTDFDEGCAAAEATQSCQSTATLDEVQTHYVRPDETNDGGNGTQGRLFEYASMPYFSTTSGQDQAPLSAWFSDAAVAAGEDGCSFEMPVAAAGFAAHPANAASNDGFLRDAGALLVIFFLTDEPDKSPESKNVYATMLTDAKAECGGADCIFVSGLIPACAPAVNQKLWQFMTLMAGDQEPPWGDIEATNDYSAVFGAALAETIADRCADIPVP